MVAGTEVQMRHPDHHKDSVRRVAVVFVIRCPGHSHSLRQHCPQHNCGKRKAGRHTSQTWIPLLASQVKHQGVEQPFHLYTIVLPFHRSTTLYKCVLSVMTVDVIRNTVHVPVTSSCQIRVRVGVGAGGGGGGGRGQPLS